LNASIKTEASQSNSSLWLPYRQNRSPDRPNCNSLGRDEQETMMRTQGPTLYYSPGACSLAVHIVLEEIGKPFHLEPVLSDKGEARMPEFRRVNAKGRIPVLLDGASVWTEAPAILLHLALAHPESRLTPTGNDELCLTLEWFNWLSGTVHSVAVRQIWRPDTFTTEPHRHESIVAKGHEHLSEAHRLIEARLPEKAWIMPSGYTILDPYLLVFYRWGNRMGLPMRESFPRWTWHTEAMLEREAVHRAVAREGVSIWR
jgi:glutathione S-transferase